MRIIYGMIIAALAVMLLIGVQKWRGPELPALTVELKPLALRIVASGEVRYPSLARIGSEITGTVLARYVREGDWVKQGQLLLALSNDEQRAKLDQAKTLLQQLHTVTRPQAQAALKEAQINAQQASREARRRQALAAKGTLSVELTEQALRAQRNADSQLLRAQLTVNALAANGSEQQLLTQRIESAEAELAKTRIHAPFSGRVQTRNVEPGDLVQSSKILLEIARSERANNSHAAPATEQPTPSQEARHSIDNNGLEVVVALDEKNFAPLKLQQKVQLIADAWPEYIANGVVSFIAPAVDSSRGTIDVHIRVLDDSHPLETSSMTFLPGMTVSANIIVAERKSALVLPNDYLQSKAGQWQVRRWQGAKVSTVAVKLGLRNMTHSEIISGLNEGDIVVQAAALRDGQRARVRFEQAPHVVR